MTKNASVTVGFYGKYIPLQGVEHIVKAASLCPQITFELIGSGQTYQSAYEQATNLNLKNITFVPRLSYQELVHKIKTFDIVLGIFGTSRKAQCVIPNKVYDAAALGKPIITADSPAIRELFTEGEDIVLSRAGDAVDLAEKILLLASDQALRERLGVAAAQTFNDCATPEKIGQDLLNQLKGLEIR